LEEVFAAIDLKHPIYRMILVGITDERAKDSFEEIPNGDGYYQILVGFDSSIGLGPENDHRLAVALFSQLSKAILACPFSGTDRETVRAALDAWPAGNLAATE
jgi:hypothetical protein